MSSSFGELRERSKKQLVGFLKTELDLGFTFAKGAEIRASMNSEHFQASCEHSRMAIDAVRRFSSRVRDKEVQREFLKRADELERLIVRIERQPKDEDERISLGNRFSPVFLDSRLF